METKGLLVEVYTAFDGVDCTAGGISSGKQHLILESYVDSGGCERQMNAPFTGDETNTVRVVVGNISGYVKAVPIKTPKGMVGPMFGGNFIYSSDSRFPYKYPVPIHDRFETQEIYDILNR